MKNLQLLENCFADTQNMQDVAKLEAISSKLIRQNTRLQKEKDQLARKAKKQELCIGHLLKKLETVADLANDQQTSFDEALHRQTETVASMLQELSKSRNVIIQLRNELEFEKVKISTTVSRTEIHRIPGDNDEDFSDDITVHRNNVVVQEKDATDLEDEIAHLRYSVIQQEAQYKESLGDNQEAIDELQANRPTHRLKRKCSGVSHMHKGRFRPDDKIETIYQPFVQEYMKEKTRFPRSGLQEVDDMEAPRPPLSRQASSVRGSTQSPCKFPEFTRSNSRSFAMDAVRRQGSSRSLNSAFWDFCWIGIMKLATEDAGYLERTSEGSPWHSL